MPCAGTDEARFYGELTYPKYPLRAIQNLTCVVYGLLDARRTNN